MGGKRAFGMEDLRIEKEDILIYMVKKTKRSMVLKNCNVRSTFETL